MTAGDQIIAQLFPSIDKADFRVRDVHTRVNTFRVRFGVKTPGITTIVSTAAFIRQNQAHSLMKTFFASLNFHKAKSFLRLQTRSARRILFAIQNHEEIFLTMNFVQ